MLAIVVAIVIPVLFFGCWCAGSISMPRAACARCWHAWDGASQPPSSGSSAAHPQEIGSAARLLIVGQPGFQPRGRLEGCGSRAWRRRSWRIASPWWC